jgi:predicted transcriptional regulator
MKVLLSIKPEFVEKILNGTKKFEFRKRSFKREGVNKVVIYSTMPVGKVVGEFEINDIIKEVPDMLWDKTKEFSGISRQFFDEYYIGKEHAFAICVGKITKYDEPMCLSSLGKDIVAPQSFRYLS